MKNPLPAIFTNTLCVIQLGILVILSIPVILQIFIPVMVIRSNSMFPSMKEGSLIIISGRLPPAAVELTGKPIVFFDPVKQKIVAHRVERVEGDALITKGDNNDFEDAYQTHAGNVIGKIIFVIPPLR